jgi:hypothetical protein
MAKKGQTRILTIIFKTVVKTSALHISRVGHWSSENDSLNWQCRFLPSFLTNLTTSVPSPHNLSYHLKMWIPTPHFLTGRSKLVLASHFFNRSFDKVGSSPWFFNRSFDKVGSSPSFFNWSFDYVGSSPSFLTNHSTMSVQSSPTLHSFTFTYISIDCVGLPLREGGGASVSPFDHL